MTRLYLFCALVLSCAFTVVTAQAFFLTSAAITSIFDTTRNSSGNAVFSNGNATMTAGGGTANWFSAFTNLAHSASQGTGKFAFRVTVNACPSVGNGVCGIGLGSSVALDNNFLGSDTNGVAIYDNGAIWLGNGTISTGGPTFAVGNTVDVEVDLSGKTISYSVAGGTFSTPVSIAGLASFTLSPGVVAITAAAAFGYNGAVSFPGFPAWNSVPSLPVTISSVNLSNTTFTPNTANGAVGTVSVTMSSGPAFSGTLSITGANTGGFHLSGTSLQEAGGSGTVAGTYSDINIVATQAGIPNSPQQISPSLVGGSIPAPAQAANFNTLIINDNFQDGTWDNTSTWLDCAMSGGTPKYWEAWSGFGAGLNGPCSAIGTAIDPVGGQKALKLHWQDSYAANNGKVNGTDIQTSDAGQVNNTGRQTSPGFYIEIVARTSLNTWPGGTGGGWMDLWSYTPVSSLGYEVDGFEEGGGPNKGGFAIHNNPSGPYCADQANGCAGLSLDVTQYHTYAWRQTSAGSDIFFCAYVDSQQYGCSSINPTSTQLAGLSMTHQVMNWNGQPTDMIGNGATGKDVWLRSIKTWSCSTNPSNLCHSSSNNP